MELFKVIEKRASVRQFRKVEIPESHLRRILDAGRRAPSGMNAQPIRYILITSPETLEKLGEVQECIAQASAAIMVLADKAKSEYWPQDASAAIENMLLAIKALGYDSVWIQGTLSRHEPSVRELLRIPEGIEIVAVLPIGKGRAEVPQREKKPLSEILHLEKW